MSDFQAIADRVEIEALCGESTDAAMMNDHDRIASLFTRDAVWRIPVANVEAAGREEIRAGIERHTERGRPDWSPKRLFKELGRAPISSCLEVRVHP